MSASSVPSVSLPPLRERKKARTRRVLANVALRLFSHQGFETTTLDEIAEQAEVSKRTVFRYFTSKEAVALAAEADLWDAYIAAVEARPLAGPLLDDLRRALVDTLAGLEAGWEGRFIMTRAVAAHAGSSVLYDSSEIASLQAQRRLVAVLEGRLGLDGREDLRLRMLGEFSLSAWRCGARNWVAGRSRLARPLPRRDDPRGPDLTDPAVFAREAARAADKRGGRDALIRCVEEAFAAIPASLELSG